MGDTVTGSSATSGISQDAIATLVQRNLFAKSALLRTVWDLSPLAMPGDKSVKIPTASNFSVTKKASGTPVEATALTYGGDTIDFDQHAVVQFLIEKRASIQSRLQLAQINIMRAIEAHAKQVDVDIHAALIAGVSTTSPDHVIAFAGSGIAAVDILEARRLLDVQEWPAEGRTIAINPNEEKALLQIDGFVRADAYGNSAIPSGKLGTLYGAEVVKTTVVTSGRPLVYHKEALAIAFQADPELDSDKDLPNVATRYSLDQLYGLEVLRSGVGVVRLGSAS